MKTQSLEYTWLDARETVTISDLSRACGLSAAELDELVEYGALRPLEQHRVERLFSAEYVMPLRSVGRLRMDFDLDLFTVALLFGYLNRIEALERQVQSLQAQLPGHERYAGEGADT